MSCLCGTSVFECLCETSLLHQCKLCNMFGTMVQLSSHFTQAHGDSIRKHVYSKSSTCQICACGERYYQGHNNEHLIENCIIIDEKPRETCMHSKKSYSGGFCRVCMTRIHRGWTCSLCQSPRIEEYDPNVHFQKCVMVRDTTTILYKCDLCKRNKLKNSHKHVTTIKCAPEVEITRPWAIQLDGFLSPCRILCPKWITYHTHASQPRPLPMVISYLRASPSIRFEAESYDMIFDNFKTVEDFNARLMATRNRRDSKRGDNLDANHSYDLIPPEIWQIIVRPLATEDLVNIGRTCNKLHYIVKNMIPPSVIFTDMVHKRSTTSANKDVMEMTRGQEITQSDAMNLFALTRTDLVDITVRYAPNPWGNRKIGVINLLSLNDIALYLANKYKTIHSFQARLLQRDIRSKRAKECVN